MTRRRFGPVSVTVIGRGDFYLWWTWGITFGISFEPLADHHPLFSERLGYWRAYHRFGYCIRLLGRWGRRSR